MAPGLGHKSWLQFGKESTYGTAVAATQRLELIKWNINQQIGVIRDPSLYAGQTARGLYQGGQLVKGTFTVRCGYEGLEEIARGCLPTYSATLNTSQITAVTGCTIAGALLTWGSAQTFPVGTVLTGANVAANTQIVGVTDSTHVIMSQAGTNGSSLSVNALPTVYDHTVTDGATLNSYTMEASVGDVTTGTCDRVVGACFSSFTIKGTAGSGNDAMLTIDVTVIGKDMSKGATPSRYQALSGCTLSAFTISAFTAPSDPLLVGQTVTGAGIPSGTVITAVNSTTNITVSNSCTSGSGIAVQASLSYPALLPVIYHHMAIASEGSGDAQSGLRWRSFEVSLTSPLAEDRYYLGSVNIDQPLRSDFVTTKWKSVQEFNSLSQYNAAKNFNPTAGYKLIFRSPTSIYATTAIASSTISTTTLTLGTSTTLYPGMVVSGTGVTAGTRIVSGSGTSYVVDTSQSVSSTSLTFTAYREIELRTNSMRFTSFSAPVENYGLILSTAEAEAFKDTTDNTGLLLRMRNMVPALS